MNFNLVDLPKEFQITYYDQGIQRMTAWLMNQSQVLSVFQVGSVSAPGISDVDLLVIFKDGSQLSIDPVLLSEFSKERYVFIHSLFGTTLSRFNELDKYTLFSNFHHLAGQQINMSAPVFVKNDEQTLKQQLALEYLLKAFISLHTNITYKTIKVRGLLLHVKALLTDLHFLNINSGEFYNSVINLITVRNNWFNHRPSDQSLKAIILEFYQLFKGFLIEIFQHYTFYVPDQPPVQLSAAIRLSHSEKTTFRHSGILLPQFILSVIKKGISLQNRLNKFTFAIPLQSNDYPDIILQRFNYLREGIIYNRQHLPGFLCTAYPLNFFKLNR